ncbi:unconventional myosin-VI-like [Saccopteryx bilineata]|uniref:unconventional myosin-VI-like n=1 Tax=Saccopteryx bilineata TaxID=59482 RepID=UPI00338FE4BF
MAPHPLTPPFLYRLPESNGNLHVNGHDGGSWPYNWRSFRQDSEIGMEPPPLMGGIEYWLLLWLPMAVLLGAMGYMFFTQEETARGQKLQHELQTEWQKRLELERALEKELRVRELQFTLEAERLHRQLLEKQLRIQELESQLLAKSQQPQEPKRSPKEQQHPCRWIGFESAGAGACDSSSEDEKAQAEAAIRTLRARPVVAKKNWSKQSLPCYPI